MQQRVPIKKFPSFDLAHKSKEELIIQNPDVTYQIRRHRNEFQLVRRFSVNKIKEYEESRGKKLPNKRRKARQSEAEVLSWVRE